MEKYDVGTPIGGERKMRRMRSPLNEMDDVVGQLNFEEDERAPPATPEAAHQNAGPQTMANISLTMLSNLLDEKIGPMQRSMSQMERQMGELSISVDARLKDMESRMDLANVRIAKLEQWMERDPPQSKEDELVEKVKVLQEQVAAATKGDGMLASEISAGSADVRERTAVIGGLTGIASIEEADAWVRDKLWLLWGQHPVKVFCEGKFTKLAFAQFPTKKDREDAVQALRDASERSWAKQDLPLETRASN